ncbi:hypothetical protein [Methylorubrum salsuginis]|uniref:Uncharacterized protein n=1 Tax=Methylorubrum salsuginis TaxID=414703 RepID=A0A1I4EHE3_9HYPH|nr:hypothetical protein [Methylorubrum salsuginis]SFL05175.1 hypothetical protein SAMN04488125_10811 [Methylorubrum salsuginis]
MASSPIAWTQARSAGVPMQRFTGHVGAVEVGLVEYDGSNRLWTWWSPLAEAAWGHAQDAEGAQRGFEAWLREWLENFRPFFEPA